MSGKGDKDIIKEQRRHIAQMEKDRRDMIKNYEKFRKELETKREYLKLAESFEDKLIKCYEQSKHLKKRYNETRKDNLWMAKTLERLEKENVNMNDNIDLIESEVDKLKKTVTSVAKRMSKTGKNCWDL